MKVDINTPSMGFALDVTPIVDVLNFMYSSAKSGDPNTKAGREVWKATIEEVNDGINLALYEEALKRSDQIAHVFDWESVTDHTPMSTFKRTKLGESQENEKIQGGVSLENYYDTRVKFIPKIRPKVPLFYTRLAGKAPNFVSVIDFRNASVTPYDEEVYYTPIWNPGSLGRHRFYDQATNLENVSIIRKDSSSPSKRRVAGAAGKGRDGRRIIQPFVGPSETILKNFRTYTRDNPYRGKFTRFFYHFASGKAERRTESIMQEVQRDANKVYSKHAEKVAKRHAHAGMLAMSSGIFASGKSARATLMWNGIPIRKMPPLSDKSSMLIARDIQKQIRQGAGTMSHSSMSGRIKSGARGSKGKVKQNISTSKKVNTKSGPQSFQVARTSS